MAVAGHWFFFFFARSKLSTLRSQLQFKFVGLVATSRDARPFHPARRAAALVVVPIAMAACA